MALQLANPEPSSLYFDIVKTKGLVAIFMKSVPGIELNLALSEPNRKAGRRISPRWTRTLTLPGTEGWLLCGSSPS
jgi:hypothetical protein